MKKLNDKIVWIFFSLIILTFIAVEFNGLSLQVPGDENVYYYMGKLVSEGSLPYKDFFYSHPPLQVFLLSVFIKLFGYNVIILKLIPFLSILFSTFLLFKITKKLGNLEALFAVILFLFSYIVLFNSVYSVGMNLTLLFVALGSYFLLNRKMYLISGIFFGFASITTLFSVVPFIAISLFLFLTNKKKLLIFLLGFSIIFIITNLLFIIIFGQKYIIPVYKYHLIKTDLNIPKTQIFLNIIKLNWPLVLSSLLLFFVKDKKKIQLPLFISLVYIIFLILLKRIFDFYFIILFFFLSIFAGYSIAYLLKKIPKKFLFLLIAILLLFIWNASADILFLNKFSFSQFEIKNEISTYIDKNFEKNILLFGDESTTPLIALITGRKIAHNIIDLNEMVFITKVADINETIEKIKNEKMIFILRTQGIAQFKEFIDFLNNNCNLRRSFEDKIEGTFLIYTCNLAT